MKKIFFAAIALMSSIAFTSCNQDFMDGIAGPLTSPEETPQTVAFGNGAVTEVPAIDLAKVTSDVVKVCNITAPTVTDENAKLVGYVLTIGENQFDIDQKAEISVTDLTSIVVGAFGMRPVEREFEGVVRCYYSANGQSIVTVSDPFKIKVIPAAPVIEEAYYYVGAANGWGGQDYKLTNGGGDVYDDPVFSVTVPAQGGDHWFKIMPESAFSLGSIWDSPSVVGVYNNGTSDLEGMFIVDKNGNDQPGSGANAWCLKEGDHPADFYKITINMMNQTYTIKPIIVAAQYYVVGGVQGWSDKNKTCLFTPEEKKNVLSYTTKWTGAWDLKIWDADGFGNWDVAWGCAVDGDNSPSGALQNSGAQAISAPSAEFYTFTIDMNTQTYTWTKLENQAPKEYESISLIGEFNGWGGDFDLTQVTPHNWYGVFTQESDGQLKYRANHDWSVNWGYGSDKDWNVADSFNKIGTNGGGNIWVPAGTYAVYLNDITNSMLILAQ
jgi:hypothetical protein